MLAIVTGASEGIGFQTALALAKSGAEVILAGRSQEKGLLAVFDILEQHPSARVRFEQLDLANLASVADFSRRISREGRALDYLVNNAGILAPPKRLTTVDGFELQLGTNHLGHFALTGRLLPLLRRATRPRVVNVSSKAHAKASIHFDDLHWRRRYKPLAAYAQSKLANLLFTFELQRRSDLNEWGILSLAAHPGFAVTNLTKSGPGSNSIHSLLGSILRPFLYQSAQEGARPVIFAATSPEARAAEYYGPRGRFETKGPVGEATIAPHARDAELAQRLWKVSEQLTRVRWDNFEPDILSLSSGRSRISAGYR